MQQRLQKILSARGTCSRRKAEEYIERGLVRVNGVVATIGDKADPERDTIEVDGKVIEERSELLYYVMDKPPGVETSNVVRETFAVSDTRGGGQRKTKNQKPKTSRTVRDLLPPKLQGVVYPVGRLDKESEGLLLFTNDGALANRLLHPRYEHEKEYEVETQDPVKDGQLTKLERGITLDKRKTKPAGVRRLAPSKFRIALTEGKNRQIRRMCQKVGAPVKTLRRVRIETLAPTDLEPGSVRALTDGEVKTLLHATGLGE